MTGASVPLMPAFYAAIEAIHDGKVAECEIEHRVMIESSDGVDHEEILTITVRRSVKTLSFGGNEQEQA